MRRRLVRSSRVMQRAQVFFAALMTMVGCGAPPEPLEPPHGFVLLVLDTLRADRLSGYGNPRQTSPAIDQLASEGVQFERVMSHAPWTLPSMVGLLSGSYPEERVFAAGKLSRSLVGAFAQAGYSTAAFTEGGYVSSFYGMDRDFESWAEHEGAIYLDLRGPIAEGDGGIESTFAAAIRWLRDNGERPFFLLVHTYEVHMPYQRDDYARDLDPGRLSPTYEKPHQGAFRPMPDEVAYVRALYDGGVRAADREVGRLLEALDELSLSERVVVVVTADHGEDLGDRDPKQLGVHGASLHRELLNVPLIVKDPRRDYPADRVGDVARLIDVMPTLLELAGIEAEDGISGRSLLPLMLGEPSGPRLAYGGFHADPSRGRFSALDDGDHKLIMNFDTHGKVSSLELYDLRRDPQERDNVAGVSTALRDRLIAKLVRLEREIKKGEELVAKPRREVPAELRERLRALGYADGGEVK